MKRIFLILCAASLALAAGLIRAAEVTATLDPAQVAVGESAELTVTVNGSSTSAPYLPEIAGLDIEHVGQATQVQIINGAMSASSVHTYQITPRRAGTFTIPSIDAGGAKSKPLTLRATGGNAANQAGRGQAAQPSGRGGATLPPPNVPMPGVNTAAPADARYGFIQLVVPKKQFFVGELVPVEVSAFVPAGVQATVNGLPTLSSEAFTLNPLGNKPPERSEREVDGRDYTVLTWHSALTAVKTGDFSLSMEMPVTVVVRDQTQRRQPRTGNNLLDQFFNDPFFDDPFTAMGRQKEVTLGSEPDVLTVQPLPTANRPADFSGAVGRFNVQASASPANAAAGDPITLRLQVSGCGDFDRVNSDGLASGTAWKTYPPKGNFEPADSTGYRGTKTFEQVVMPRDAAVKEIPALRFSFFDPETKRYETLATAAIPVSVTGSAASAAVAAPAVASTPSAPAVPELVPNKVESGRTVATLRPIFLNPWFVAAQGLPLCALAGGLLFIRHQRRFAADPRLARASEAERAIHTRLEAMDQAVRQHASTEFFLAARGALQQRLGERWGVRPETITLVEINARLNGEAENIRPVFEMADQASYSGQEFGDADYHQWKQLVVTQLKALEKQS